jgi:hypothetical protein
MWGLYPLNFHGCTEAVLIAMQTWDYQDMTFIPHLNFFELISEEESIKSWQDPSYKPRTYLMDEVTPGNYELVITSFHGGPFVRYKLGHLIKITSLRNERLDIDIPQMEFLTRVDDQIDIAGFTRLSEKVIWQAIENTGVPYVDWAARKEVLNKPALHLYVEARGNGHNAHEIGNPLNALNIHLQLLDREIQRLPDGKADGLRDLVLEAGGIDLDLYKDSCVLRRITLRIHSCGVRDLRGYLRLVGRDPEERGRLSGHARVYIAGQQRFFPRP